ncbi:MAG: hypothetical protein ACI8W8_004679 [Rhodothermales bacterium]
MRVYKSKGDSPGKAPQKTEIVPRGLTSISGKY